MLRYLIVRHITLLHVNIVLQKWISYCTKYSRDKTFAIVSLRWHLWKKFPRKFYPLNILYYKVAEHGFGKLVLASNLFTGHWYTCPVHSLGNTITYFYKYMYLEKFVILQLIGIIKYKQEFIQYYELSVRNYKEPRVVAYTCLYPSAGHLLPNSVQLDCIIPPEHLQV